jgi:hypothetical protein
MRIVDFLNRGTLVEVIGTPFAKAFQQEDGFIRTEIRMNIARTNILRPVMKDDTLPVEMMIDESNFEVSMDDFSIEENDFS